MQVTETKTEGLKRDFTIVVPVADIEERVNKRLKELSGTVRIPGFRPGKVPAAMLKKRYGDSVMGEVLEKTVSETSFQAMNDRGLRPALQPKVEITSFEEGSDLEYTIAVEVMPDIETVDYSGIKLERRVAEVEDSVIDETLQRMAEGSKSSEPVAKARKSKKGDIAVINFVGKVDDEEFPGGKADGYHLELGSNSFIPGFEDQLIGAKPGDHVEVKVDFPKEYGAENLAGKAAVFDVDVTELRTSVPAVIDDEFATKAGMESLDALKKAVRDEHEREYKSIGRMHLKRSLLDKLSEMYDFEVPEGLVEQELDAIWTQFEEQRKQNPDAVKEEYGDKSDDDIKAELREISERRIRLGLVLAEVGQSNNIKVTQEDINRAIMSEARNYPGQEQKVVEFYQNNAEAMNSLQAPLLEDRVVDFMLELATVTEKTMSREELMAEPEEEAPAKKKAAAKKAPAKKKAAAKKAPAKKTAAKKE
ncbi:MAG: trigger factor [Rhodospirillales bacterium]|nr:trigger factor [Rhodospirillales bacterium]